MGDNLLSYNLTVPSPQPAITKDLSSVSDARLVTQLSAPVGISYVKNQIVSSYWHKITCCARYTPTQADIRQHPKLFTTYVLFIKSYKPNFKSILAFGAKIIAMNIMHTD